MNWADMYNQASSATGAILNVDSPVGPNPGSVTGSGQVRGAAGGNGPAFSWLTMVAMLVLIRVFAEMGGRG